MFTPELNVIIYKKLWEEGDKEGGVIFYTTSNCNLHHWFNFIYRNIFIKHSLSVKKNMTHFRREHCQLPWFPAVPVRPARLNTLNCMSLQDAEMHCSYPTGVGTSS
jgi:hypothetical protein